jgi:hypothetical protein
LSDADLDLGSGGVLLLPDANNDTLLLAGGKPGYLYLLNSQATSAAPTVLPQINVFQAFFNTYVPWWVGHASSEPPYGFALDSNPHLHGTPVYWRGPDPNFAYVYAWSEKDYLKAFKFGSPAETVGGSG